MKFTKSMFLKRLEKSEIFEDLHIDLSNNDIIITNLPKGIEFTNCTIISNSLTFKNIHNDDYGILFEKCNIQSKIIIEDCKIHTVRFSDIYNLLSLRIAKSYYVDKTEIEVFQFSNENTKEGLNTEFRFQDCIFKSQFGFYNVNHTSGFFGFNRNDLGNSVKKYANFTLSNSNFKNMFFQENNFLNPFNVFNCVFENLDIEKIKRYQNSIFIENTFNKIGLINTIFKGKCDFVACSFTDISFFELNENNFSEYKFYDCVFYKETSFNNSKIRNLIFDKTIFNNICTFQNTFLDTISIDRTIFEKGALFDDIQIKKIDDCNRRTIRTIKQELQKAENKIDFSRFRVYEFNAYRKDIRKKLDEFKKDKNRFYHRKREPIQLKRDLFILNVSDIVSEYGTDWKRAIKFTLIFGFVAFTLFFILENLNKSFDLSNWEDFVYGYFRFFLITDFKNEYYQDGESILKFNCFLSLVPFIIGKIAVAFGLYEMIQSFRKFKA